MNDTAYSNPVSASNAIVVATPKQLTVEILRQSDAILELKKRMKLGVHFGPPYPGSKKDTLLKPGAEWLAKRFGLRSHYEELTKRIDINFEQSDRTFILLEYRCLMIDIESGVVVGEAIGSCNSREDKYAWRWVSEFDVPDYLDKSRLVSKDGTVTEFDFAVKKAETSGKFGKPADYWQAFQDAVADGSAQIVQKEDSKGVKRTAYQIGGRTFRVPHDNPLDLLNTLSKMAQKRSKVSSVMEATGASSYFAPGDDEVKDIYVEEGDFEVIDADFVDVKDEPSSAPSTAPSTAPAAAPASPASASASPASANGDDSGNLRWDEMTLVADNPLPADDDAPPNQYRVTAVKVVPQGNSHLYLLKAGSTNITLFGGDKFREAGIQPEFWRDNPGIWHAATPALTVKADLNGTGDKAKWEVHSIAQEAQ